MSKMPLTVWPSQANFILFRPTVAVGRRSSAGSGSGGASSKSVSAGGAMWQALLDQSVLVRDCSSWDGLTDCLRVTVGTAEENDAFLTALQTALQARD
jgi:histidinol-phosphate aminotransferase